MTRPTASPQRIDRLLLVDWAGLAVGVAFLATSTYSSTS